MLLVTFGWVRERVFSLWAHNLALRRPVGSIDSSRTVSELVFSNLRK